MSEQERTILDAHIKGITLRLLWQGIIGWTSIVASVLFVYFSLKAQINDVNLYQSKTDAIQDMRIESIKRDLEIQALQIKDLNERYHELESLKNKQ